MRLFCFALNKEPLDKKIYHEKAPRSFTVVRDTVKVGGEKSKKGEKPAAKPVVKKTKEKYKGEPERRSVFGDADTKEWYTKHAKLTLEKKFESGELGSFVAKHVGEKYKTGDYKSMNSELAALFPYYTPGVFSANKTERIIAGIQQALIDTGVKGIKVDGKCGPKTIAGIAEYANAYLVKNTKFS